MKINDEGTSNAAHWYERAMKAESRLAEAEALLRGARASIPCNAKFTLRRIDAFLATADSADGAT